MTWKNELPLIRDAGVIEVKFDLETSRKIREAAVKSGRDVDDCVVAMVKFAMKFDEQVEKNKVLLDSHFRKQEL